ncbi:50S ribosomal protein L19 [bacterium]|jgi:large subunit ribosomal protein L19|nr:50S ribosomal protein L19 [bacterium]MBT4292354.1 50S ribosomal protein L19 [bacterium]
MSNIIDSIRSENLRSDLPEFGVGDTICCKMRISEAGKTRVQNYEGVLIARQGTANEASITVRKISNGVAVERVIPVESPNLTGIDVVRHGRIRRAKLYYLRNLTGRKARIREKFKTKKS